MTKSRRVLIAGESWTVHSIHQKGFDSFTTTEYAEGVRWLREAIRDYVLGGGGLVMIGGYMTFQGIDAKARYRDTEVAEVLGVEMEAGDDRAERPQGVKPRVAAANHPIVGGLEAEWPALLGYNRFAARQKATVVATVGNDPLIVAAEFGKGRSVAFASDCGPHWAPPAFVDWPGYTTLWRQIVGWTSGV